MQVCRNGHRITSQANRHSDRRKRFCPDCGSETIVSCGKCNALIQGDYYLTRSPSSAVRSAVRVPDFCHGCGHAYPWREARQQSLIELVEGIEGLPDEDRRQLGQALTDIQTDGPRTEIGASRLRKLLKQGALTAGSALYKVALDVATDAAKKMIVGS